MEPETNNKWWQCQQLIYKWLSEEEPDERRRTRATDIYKKWFAPLALNHYDSQQNKVFLSVPSKQVYEVIELIYVSMMSKVLKSVFGQGVSLIYNVRQPEPSADEVAKWLAEHSPYNPQRDPHHIHVENARERLEQEMRRVWGDERFLWMNGYERIADWLTDNKGKGLLLCAPTGRGKTDICQRILPDILCNGGRPIPYVEAKDLCKPKSADLRDDLKTEPILIVDKLGKEPRKFFSDDNNSFSDLLENAERTGQLLIICTQLSTTTIDPERYPEAAAQYPDSIQHRYGQDVLSRLAAVVKATRIVGPDMRR